MPIFLMCSLELQRDKKASELAQKSVSHPVKRENFKTLIFCNNLVLDTT